MNIVVAIKHIPSIADDLPVKGNNVDFDSVDFVLNESLATRVPPPLRAITVPAKI